MIADRPLTDIVPLQLADAGRPTRTASKVYRTVTQFSMKPIEELGLLKMDFLGPAQPRRDRGRARHHRALDRRAARHGDAAARRRARPTRCSPRGDSIGVFQFESEGMREALQEGPPDGVRRPRRAHRAVPPGRDGPDPDLRARQARPRRRSRIPDERLRADHRADEGRDPLPGAGDADRQDARRLQRRQGRRPAQGDRQEEPRGDGASSSPSSSRAAARRARARAVDRVAVDDEREVGRLLVQQVATPPATR